MAFFFCNREQHHALGAKFANKMFIEFLSSTGNLYQFYTLDRKLINKAAKVLAIGEGGGQ